MAAWMLAGCCSAGHGAEWPKPFSATYHGSKYLLGKIDAVLTLEQLGQHLRYTARTKVSVALVSYEVFECSVMRVVDGTVQPLRHMHRDGHSAKRNTLTVFDWDQAQATVTFDDGRRIELRDLPRPTWDPMSVQVQLMIDAKRGLLEGARNVRLVDGERRREWPMRFRGIEPVKTRHGTVDAVKVERTDSKPFGVWLVPDYDYMPARLQVGEIAVSLTSDPASAKRAINNGGASVPDCEPASTHRMGDPSH